MTMVMKKSNCQACCRSISLVQHENHIGQRGTLISLSIKLNSTKFRDRDQTATLASSNVELQAFQKLQLPSKTFFFNQSKNLPHTPRSRGERWPLKQSAHPSR